MISITDKKKKQIEYIFENLIEEKFYVCPKCGMPVKEGYVCLNCGYDIEDNEDAIEYEEFELWNL